MKIFNCDNDYLITLPLDGIVHLSVGINHVPDSLSDAIVALNLTGVSIVEDKQETKVEVIQETKPVEVSKPLEKYTPKVNKK